MKLCYVDESGNPTQDPCFVMVGILVDAHRLNKTREEFSWYFNQVRDLFTEPLRELKGSKIIHGRDRWRNIDLKTRKTIVDSFCNWIQERKHHLALAAIDYKKWAEKDNLVRDRWLACALHIALQMQKRNQNTSNNKGRTLLFFDENKAKADRLAELLWDPPDWTDDYYNRHEKQGRLDQLIDSAFTVKSHHAGLVQIADLYAFIFRRYAEITDYGRTEEWEGEHRFLRHCIEILKPRMLPQSTRWPARTHSECAEWYNSLAPHSLHNLGLS
ncbi:DUF3800 domain-containing protein [Kyrpidia spormannii]|uniref:Uncharacterized protein n=1 Tax=Kyrpidia spormannii TaxID=2055160 RepID=A0ACA8ZDI8_9BACL|nr:DUF3800 domain-containing protein [Kyrpidia spormannii]CAB3395123.1 conserved protein of unknown function [Kyrpidia spormannii]